jgi:hypothetical protein
MLFHEAQGQICLYLTDFRTLVSSFVRWQSLPVFKLEVVYAAIGDTRIFSISASPPYSMQHLQATPICMCPISRVIPALSSLPCYVNNVY